MEGGHCKVGNIQANFFAQINDETGVLTPPESLMMKNFTEASLILKNPTTKQLVPFEDYFNAINAGAKEGIFYGTTTVEVRFMNTEENCS